MTRGTSLLLSTAALAASTIAAAAPSSAAEPGAKVVQGRTAPTGAFPAQVALVRPDVPDNFQGQFCAGTLITPEWVLTAAHCVEAVALPDVVLGTNRLDGTGTRVPTIESRVHSGYSDVRPGDDVGLVRLAAPAVQAPAVLAYAGMESLETAGAASLVSGWGSVDEDMSAFPVELLEADLPIIADDVCATEYQQWQIALPHPSSIVCAGAGTAQGDEQPSACYGDSGGPLWATGADGLRRQIGVVSGGAICGFSPGIFSSVVSYVPFLEEVIGQQLASFSDIPGTLHEPNIERLVLAQLAGGVGGGLYAPAAAVTRGQLATFLVRALQLPAATTGPFTDVAGHRHEADVNAVSQAGVAGGFPDGTFRPDQPVSRDQMATFLARAIGLAPLDAGPFVDIVDNVHAGAINAVAAAGIAGGVGDGRYAPFASVSRGQMATFLARAFLGG